MRLGLIARADNTGLGMQTLEFYRHMKPDKTMVVDISAFNKNKQYPERYPEKATFIYGFPTKQDIDEFLKDLDVLFVAESPYNYYLYDRAKELGVKTAVQYNYEFFDWFAHPEYPKPDMLIAPSRWHYEDIQKWCDEFNVKHVYLHCPVNRDELPFREIRKAKTFLHVAGRSAAHDRNGTETVIQASRYLNSDAQILVHFQGEQGLAHQATKSVSDYAEYLSTHGDEDKCTIEQVELDDYSDIYRDGDVLLLPRRYGGNCLPLNEALSVGMPVIMTDISPNNSLLPKNWLIPATIINQFTPRTVIDIYSADPLHLARCIDRFADMPEEAMLLENVKASNLGQSISWEMMRWQYAETLEKLCQE